MTHASARWRPRMVRRQAPATSAAGESPAPVQLSRTGPPVTPSRRPPSATLQDAPERGRPRPRPGAAAAPNRAVHAPTLGRLGGLPAMAQTLPTVERFMRTLPSPPPEPLLAELGRAGDFAANLPSLAGFTAGAVDQPPSFPARAGRAQRANRCAGACGRHAWSGRRPFGGRAGAADARAPAATSTPNRSAQSRAAGHSRRAAVDAERAGPARRCDHSRRRAGLILQPPERPLSYDRMAAGCHARHLVARGRPDDASVIAERTLTGNILPAAAGEPVQRDSAAGLAKSGRRRQIWFTRRTSA